MPDATSQRRKFFEEAAEQFASGPVKPETVELYTPAIQDARRWYAEQPRIDHSLLLGVENALRYFEESKSETGAGNIMWNHKLDIARLLRTYARAMGGE